MLRISSSVRPLVAVTVIDCSRLVSRSLALTDTMPSAEMWKVTSISTSPRGARAAPECGARGGGGRGGGGRPFFFRAARAPPRNRRAQAHHLVGVHALA